MAVSIQYKYVVASKPFKQETIGSSEGECDVAARSVLRMSGGCRALAPAVNQIQDQALSIAVLHADETGWRVNGKTH